jgi:hypothetical protein
MALHPHNSSSDDNLCSFSPPDGSGATPSGPMRGNVPRPLGIDDPSVPNAENPLPHATVSTLEVSPLQGEPGAMPSLRPPTATLSTASAALPPSLDPRPARTPDSPRQLPEPPTAVDSSPVSAAVSSPATDPAAPPPPAASQRPAKATGSKLRPKRRRGKIRLAHLMQAWTVSLVVHVVILSATPSRR